MYAQKLARYVATGSIISATLFSYVPSIFATNSNDEPASSTINSIELSLNSDSTKLEWDVDGDANSGYKVVYSMEENPEYPPLEGGHAHYTDDEYFKLEKLGTPEGEGSYYVRVCEYLGASTCGTYSNQLEVTLEQEDDDSDNDLTSTIESIVLVVGEEDYTVEWEITGENQEGVKVVFSMNEDPTYEPREGDMAIYIDDEDTNSVKLKGFSGEGTYYVRVCEYLKSSECGTYSNQVTVDLPNDDGKGKDNNANHCEFDDVDSEHTLCKHLKHAFAKGIVKPNDKFNPELEITRGELASIVVRAFEIEANTEGDLFDDVPEDYTHFESIMTLKNLDVVKGSHNLYKPDEPTTRGQVVRIIKRTVEMLNLDDFSRDNEEVDVIFKDAGIERHTFAHDIADLIAASKELDEPIINGYPDGTFKADKNVNRIEAVAFIDRALAFKN
ncbi:S-layer homology domain-containing protein [Candidatus Dojkabacteria bacterium]|uniref:S-layer homology domain-containing protein n=1 Tax=Candidatus Dojkabacteria bacterium TaxID=2099670 RepID=A0A955L9G5_9BACT|nr:S-layer homology domain-containing protein [Candidatus Dojkabacteria bacterium]